MTTCTTRWRRCAASTSASPHEAHCENAFQDEACVVRPRWAARFCVLGWPGRNRYRAALRPCLALAHRARTTRRILKRVLRIVLTILISGGAVTYILTRIDVGK